MQKLTPHSGLPLKSRMECDLTSNTRVAHVKENYVENNTFISLKSMLKTREEKESGKLHMISP